MQPCTGIVVKAGEQPAAGAGEAANPQYKGGNKSLDRGQGQDGR